MDDLKHVTMYVMYNGCKIYQRNIGLTKAPKRLDQIVRGVLTHHHSTYKRFRKLDDIN